MGLSTIDAPPAAPRQETVMADAELVARYDGRVPRYTSYPTAPHFSSAIGAETYAKWLGALSPAAPLSLYLHVPFCDRLCY